MEEFNQYFENITNSLLRHYREFNPEILELFDVLKYLNRKLTDFDKKVFYITALEELTFISHILPPELIEDLIHELLDLSIELELYEISTNYQEMYNQLTLMRKEHDF